MKKALERTVHKAGEKMGNVEKTEYDPHVKQMLQKIETGEKEMLKICTTFECLLQPNSSKRVGNSMYDKINRKIERVSPYQEFGQSLKDFGDAIDKTDPFFDAVIKLGVNEKLIGQAENELCDVVSKSFYFPLKDLIHHECKRMHEDKELLESKRIDFEIMKGKLKKANSGTPEYDKLTADVESVSCEFRQHQERLLKVLDAINEKLLTQKSYFQELLKSQIHFHTKSLEFLNYSKEDLENVKTP